MAFQFPQDPDTTPEVELGGVTYNWDGEKWVAQGGAVSGDYIPLNDWSTLPELS